MDRAKRDNYFTYGFGAKSLSLGMELQALLRSGARERVLNFGVQVKLDWQAIPNANSGLFGAWARVFGRSGFYFFFKLPPQCEKML